VIRLKRKAALFSAALAALPLSSVVATPASAAPSGVYFCYYEETITTVGTEVPYVVPASITTQPYQCPPGTIAQKIA